MNCRAERSAPRGGFSEHGLSGELFEIVARQTQDSSSPRLRTFTQADSHALASAQAAAGFAIQSHFGDRARIQCQVGALIRIAVWRAVRSHDHMTAKVCAERSVRQSLTDPWLNLREQAGGG